ncbi:MAG TPA: hypothetical protein VMV74_07020 [Bacteroidales bacterium]|nr:hypothetical protein [Bacteroidales bacterium]
MRNENDIPGLIPFDDRYPSPENLFRRPEDMSDDQFALLAAAWADGGLDHEHLFEFESHIADNPERKAMAEEFKRIRLTPGNEKWHGRDASLKTTEMVIIFKRVMYVALASAAVFLAFFTLTPLLKKTITESSPVILPETEITATMKEPVPSALPVDAKVIIVNTKNIPVSQNVTDPVQMESRSFPRTTPLTVSSDPGTVRFISGLNTTELISMTKYQMPAEILNDPADVNWIMKGITALSKIITKDDKPVNGYLIAGACVKGLNTVLGWEMEFERVLSDEGKPISLNFSSSLLSFSSPVKKSIQEP